MIQGGYVPNKPLVGLPPPGEPLLRFQRLKWEYRSCVYMNNESLNRMGKEGWELVAIYNDWYFFKRPLLEE